MAAERNVPPNASDGRMVQAVGERERRALVQRQGTTASVLSGFAFFGRIGWAIVVPTLLGAAGGQWLDEHYPARHSWTLTLLIGGLLLGCVHIWRWLQREHRSIRDEQGGGRDESH
ncbi:MAG: AtpZ/AtpI family protein [Gammaproteobacteria bacterium]|nr:AtpZ/AtpI family protein [Gammaproteobacteria bacterium]